MGRLLRVTEVLFPSHLPQLNDGHSKWLCPLAVCVGYKRLKEQGRSCYGRQSWCESQRVFYCLTVGDFYEKCAWKFPWERVSSTEKHPCPVSLEMVGLRGLEAQGMAQDIREGDVARAVGRVLYCFLTLVSFLVPSVA